MSLINKLTSQGSPLTPYNGNQPPQMANLTPNSRLHNQYSINGNPFLDNKPTPSQLDLNGVTPPKYSDNPPQ